MRLEVQVGSGCAPCSPPKAYALPGSNSVSYCDFPGAQMSVHGHVDLATNVVLDPDLLLEAGGESTEFGHVPVLRQYYPPTSHGNDSPVPIIGRFRRHIASILHVSRVSGMRVVVDMAYEWKSHAGWVSCLRLSPVGQLRPNSQHKQTYEQ